MAIIDDVLGVLHKAPKPMTARAIRESLGLPKDSTAVHKVLSPAYIKRKIERRRTADFSDRLEEDDLNSLYIWAPSNFDWEAWKSPENLEEDVGEEVSVLELPQNSSNTPRTLDEEVEAEPPLRNVMAHLRKYAYDKKVDAVIENLRASGQMPHPALFSETEVRFRILSVAFERGIAIFQEEVA